MRLSQIKKVAVIGAGIMGHGFAQTFAQHGYPVALYDIDEGILKKAIAQVAHHLETLVEHRMITRRLKKETLDRIRCCTDLEDAAGRADFVLEAVPEVMELKKEVFSELDRLAPSHAILASNTSGLSITEIASGTNRPEKTIIAHGINPPSLIPLVEVVRGEKTSDETVELTYRLMLKLGKKPVRLLKEVPGFLFNRLQFALYREALHCLEMGVATAEDIDLVVKVGYGFRLPTLGPLETSDFGGLDTFYRICQNLLPQLDDSREPSPALKRLVEEGKLGVKSGEGFYKYPPATVRRRIRERDRKLINQLRLLQSS